MKDAAKQVTDLVYRIAPMLSDHSREIQGAALADLLAIWLAGHMDREGSQTQAIRDLRERILRDHIEVARKLIPVNEAIIRKRHGLTA